MTRKVLVLEDEANIRSFVVINLKRAGYDAIEAGTGEEALAQMNRRLQTSARSAFSPSTQEKGGIALLNVNNRIHLLFGEEYGLRGCGYWQIMQWFRANWLLLRDRFYIRKE